MRLAPGQIMECSKQSLTEAGTQVNKNARVTQVFEHLENYEYLIEDLSNVVESLRARLAPIIRPFPVGSEMDATKEDLVPLAHDIASKNLRFRDLLSLIKGIINNLEI